MIIDLGSLWGSYPRQYTRPLNPACHWIPSMCDTMYTSILYNDHYSSVYIIYYIDIIRTQHAQYRSIRYYYCYHNVIFFSVGIIQVIILNIIISRLVGGGTFFFFFGRTHLCGSYMMLKKTKNRNNFIRYIKIQ